MSVELSKLTTCSEDRGDQDEKIKEASDFEGTLSQSIKEPYKEGLTCNDPYEAIKILSTSYILNDIDLNRARPRNIAKGIDVNLEELKTDVTELANEMDVNMKDLPIMKDITELAKGIDVNLKEFKTDISELVSDKNLKLEETENSIKIIADEFTDKMKNLDFQFVVGSDKKKSTKISSDEKKSAKLRANEKKSSAKLDSDKNKSPAKLDSDKNKSSEKHSNKKKSSTKIDSVTNLSADALVLNKTEKKTENHDALSSVSFPAYEKPNKKTKNSEIKRRRDARDLEELKRSIQFSKLEKKMKQRVDDKVLLSVLKEDAEEIEFLQDDLARKVFTKLVENNIPESTKDDEEHKEASISNQQVICKHEEAASSKQQVGSQCNIENAEGFENEASASDCSEIVASTSKDGGENMVDGSGACGAPSGDLIGASSPSAKKKKNFLRSLFCHLGKKPKM